ncbi:MAG TPA: hypothetical protein DEP88_02175 [Verrucomicrobiales bacterium]|jgi:hypothetical protein|nr:hypothetical protein [Verrucomicrobiales bacterium]
MTKQYLLLAYLTSLINGGFVSGAVEDELPVVTAMIRFQNEAGVLLPGIQSGAGCTSFTGNDSLRDKKVSDAKGLCIFKLKALSGIGVWTEKDGYYQSIAPARNERPFDMRFRFDPFIYDGIDRDDLLTRKVDPPMKKEVKLEASITLREIKNPIPLYVKRVRMDIPARDVWLGYDFEIGDWVKPHGKGVKSDMRIRSAPKRHDPADPNGWTLLPGVATLEVDFGKDGGIIRVTKDNGWLAVSEMKMPHLAPEAGYDKLPILKIKHTTFEDSSELEKIPGNNEYLLRKANGYFFRTRVKREGDKVVSANYGKLMGNINYRPAQLDDAWWGDKKKNAPAFGSIEFTYYFNPTANDWNLEFDVKKNLFKRSDQWIREP